MIEFSEDFSTEYSGTPAVEKRVYYRIAPLKGEVPYTDNGLDISLFSYASGLSASIKKVLADFNTSVTVSGDRVIVGTVEVEIPADT
jgi:hypothetical protein